MCASVSVPYPPPGGASGLSVARRRRIIEPPAGSRPRYRAAFAFPSYASAAVPALVAQPAEARRSGRRQCEFDSRRGHAPPQPPSHALVPQQVDGPARGAGPGDGYEGSTPSERTHHQCAGVPPQHTAPHTARSLIPTVGRTSAKRPATGSTPIRASTLATARTAPRTSRRHDSRSTPPSPCTTARRPAAGAWLRTWLASRISLAPISAHGYAIHVRLYLEPRRGRTPLNELRTA